MSKPIDLFGNKFGRLTVIRKIDKNKWGNSRWLCLCDCGKEKIIRGSHLKNGHTKSCGCLHKDIMTKHGHKKKNQPSKTYRSWNSMIQRCINPKDTAYRNYGGRGITVCKRWRKFENFLEDMGVLPEGHQIDRINNDMNYCKANCRWVTSKINNRHKRNNLYFIYKNKTQLLIEWAEEVGIPYDTLWNRIFRLSWPIDKALTTPVQKRRRQKK